MQAAAAGCGIEARYSAFLEGASAALGFSGASAATAFLQIRPLVIGVPRVPDNDTGFHLGVMGKACLAGVTDEQAATQAARFMASLSATGDLPEAVRGLLRDLMTAPGTLAEHEPGSLVVPDITLSIPEMGKAAAGRVAPSAKAGNAGKNADPAMWQLIVARGLQEGVIAVMDALLRRDVGQLAQSIARDLHGWSARDCWSKADQTVATMLVYLGFTVPQKQTQVTAEILLDDGKGSERFDATPFLRDAAAAQILALPACGWRGDYPADDVAWFVRKMAGYEDVDALMTRMEKNGYGFEVWVDPHEAHAWLAANRQDVHAAMLASADPETASELVTRLESIATEAQGSYDAFRSRAIGLLDGLGARWPEDEAWSAIEELVRRPDIDDLHWLLGQLRAETGTPDQPVPVPVPGVA